MLYTLSRLSHRAMRHEQSANLKFLAKLGETPSESFAMLQQVYGEETMSRTIVHVHLKGTRGSKRDGMSLKMIHGLEDLQQAERQTTSSM